MSTYLSCANGADVDGTRFQPIKFINCRTNGKKRNEVKNVIIIIRHLLFVRYEWIRD